MSAADNEYFYSSIRNWAGESGPAIAPIDPENWGITGYLPAGHPALPPYVPTTEGVSFLENNPEHWPIFGNLITHAADLIHSSNGWYGIGVLLLGGAGVLYLLRGSSSLKRPVKIAGHNVKPWQLGIGALGVIMAGTYLSHESFALAAKKKKKSSSSTPASKPADLGAPGESVGPAFSHSSSSKHSSKPKAPRSSGKKSTEIPPAALGAPGESAQPHFRTPSKSHPILTSHGFAHSPEQSTLSGPGNVGRPGPGSNVHALSHIVPGLKGGNTLPSVPSQQSRGSHIANVNAQNIKNNAHALPIPAKGPSQATEKPGAKQTIKLSPSAEDALIQHGAGTGTPNISRPPFAGTDITVGDRFTGLLQGERRRLGGTSPTHSVNVPASVGINDAMMQGKIPMSREMMQQMSTGNAGGGIHDFPSNAPKPSTSGHPMGGMPSTTVTLVDPFTNQTKTINDPFTAQTMGTRVWANLHSPIDSTASGGRGFDIIGNATTITRTNAQGMLQSQSGSPFRNDASGGCIDTSGNPAPCP